MSVREELNRFGKYVVQQSRANLTRRRKRDTGGLYDSLRYDVSAGPRSFTLSISMADYGEFVDKGVKGVSSSAKAPASPFRFGSGRGRKGGLTEGIDGWVRRRNIQFRDRKTGQFMTRQQTAFLIRRSIWHKGIETTNFFTKPFEAAFRRLPDDLIEEYGLEVEDLMKFALK